jgi:hypothetical protein
MVEDGVWVRVRELADRIDEELERMGCAMRQAGELLDAIHRDERVFAGLCRKMEPEETTRLNMVWKDGLRQGQEIGFERGEVEGKLQIVRRMRDLGVSEERIGVLTGVRTGR